MMRNKLIEIERLLSELDGCDSSREDVTYLKQKRWLYEGILIQGHAEISLQAVIEK